MQQQYENAKLNIRFATGKDIPQLNEILNYYIQNTVYSMSYSLRTKWGARQWLQMHGDAYPLFVAEIGDKVVGWSSISMYRNTEGYAGSVEDSVYVHPDFRGMGIGRVLLKAALTAAQSNGYRTVIAFITSNNAASIGLHQALGFEKTGCLRQTGYKLNQVLDIDIMQYFVKI